MIPLRLDDLDPDGVKIIVKWDKFVVGASVFIPCINTEKARKQLKRVAQMKQYETTTHVCIENGMWGVRMWRLL
mgnify:FL=1|jgi:phosphoribosylamine-glycine ligase|tara:strand:+ start:227 stop:448 length:222 start_codon:yes stop_codon:yes gene_type:complete